jgi:hypothetical protein
VEVADNDERSSLLMKGRKKKHLNHDTLKVGALTFAPNDINPKAFFDAPPYALYK